LVERALDERAERARGERMRLRSMDPTTPWTDYTITSASSGKSYRVALRGRERGVSYCSCPDFRKNTLGTCKHVLYALARMARRFPASVLAKPYRRTEISIYLRYTEDVELRLGLPTRLDSVLSRIVGPLVDRPITDLHDLMRRLKRLASAGADVKV